MDRELADSISTAKRSCSRCNLQKMMRKNEEDKENAIRASRNAYEVLKRHFEEKRRKEETTPEQLRAIKEGKALCLDAIDACKECDKERPRIKEILETIK